MCAFGFDPKQLANIGHLAEAFIHKELDADLLDAVDLDELKDTMETATIDGEIDFDGEVYKTSISV
jgi:hypothetical protein